MSLSEYPRACGRGRGGGLRIFRNFMIFRFFCSYDHLARNGEAGGVFSEFPGYLVITVAEGKAEQKFLKMLKIYTPSG